MLGYSVICHLISSWARLALVARKVAIHGPMVTGLAQLAGEWTSSGLAGR